MTHTHTHVLAGRNVTLVVCFRTIKVKPLVTRLNPDGSFGGSISGRVGYGISEKVGGRVSGVVDGIIGRITGGRVVGIICWNVCRIMVGSNGGSPCMPHMTHTHTS